MSNTPQISNIKPQPLDSSAIFIVGANGQLGVALRDKYPNAQFADIKELDITDKASVENFDWSAIEILINAAAYTNVDGAETPEGRRAAWSVNADAVANLVAVSAQHDMTLLHISSDYVFDGSAETHTEGELFAPLSVYGASKAAGDIIVSLAPKFYILRTSWVIGEGKNFVRIMLDLADKDISPTVVHDQVGRLTFTSELVRAIDHLLFGAKPSDIKPQISNMETAFPYGTYNVSNDGESASWADITREIYKLAGRDDLTVTNTTTEEYYKGKENIAPRPLNSTLSLDKIQSTGFVSTDWKNQLAEYIENHVSIATPNKMS